MKDLVKLEERIDTAVESKNALYSISKIESDHDADNVANTLKWVKGTIKEVKADLKTITDPLNQALKAARGVAKKSLDPLEEGKRYGDNLLVAWRKEQKRKEQEAKAELASAAKEGKTGAELVSVAKAAKAPAKVQGVAYRTYYSFEVVDASLVPRHFLMVDEAALGRYARAMKGTGEVPGVVFTSREGTVDR